MIEPNHRHRLCEEVLGERLAGAYKGTVVVSLPIQNGDITEAFLMAAQEAVHSFSPEQVRSVLPFVLDALQSDRTDLFGSGYFNSFFLHVNADFQLPMEAWDASGKRYTSDFRENWVSPTLSAMSRHEQNWAFLWTEEILKSAESEVMLLIFENDLIMFARLLAMALGKSEAECPSLP